MKVIEFRLDAFDHTIAINVATGKCDIKGSRRCIGTVTGCTNTGKRIGRTVMRLEFHIKAVSADVIAVMLRRVAHVAADAGISDDGGMRRTGIRISGKLKAVGTLQHISLRTVMRSQAGRQRHAVGCAKIGRQFGARVMSIGAKIGSAVIKNNAVLQRIRPFHTQGQIASFVRRMASEAVY